MTDSDCVLPHYRLLHLGCHPLRIGLFIEGGRLCRLLLPSETGDETGLLSLQRSPETPGISGRSSGSATGKLHPDQIPEFCAGDAKAGASERTRNAVDEALADEAFSQLQAWLDGRLKRFDLPLAPPSGTALQLLIRERIAAIPRGETRCYKELGPPRCVARVCSTNPLPLLLPCHRVIPAGGSIAAPGRYRGGTKLKQWLLQAEAAG